MKSYFDYAATAPPFPESINVFKDISLSAFGNPSSNHNLGLMARNILNQSREQFLKLLGITNASVILTSGGSEANNLILNSVLHRYPDKKILVAHDSHESCYYVTKKNPNQVDTLHIDNQGQINISALEKVLSSNYSLVCVLHGNNETGVVQQDLNRIIEICTQKNVLLHIDGVQVVGHIPINIKDFKGMFYTFSSHKFGAPRGNGGVITGSPELLTSHISGGPQEKNLRAGTENVAGFAAAVTALELSLDRMAWVEDRLKEYSEYIITQIKARFPETVINSKTNGLPGIVSFSIPGIKGSVTVTEMAMFGYALSSGSACHSSMEIPPRVIMAMGRDMKTAFGTLRISMGYHTEAEEVYAMTNTLIKVIERQIKE
jgi:cysteine desulfurase